uniref:Uncharacterized protein n=1 Tax=Arundo donax TaxID=35708 RepID=A0A0A9BND3_ARUDO
MPRISSSWQWVTKYQRNNTGFI